MKFTIHRDPLLNALSKTQSVVEKRNTVAILSNILCVVKNGVLSLSATDLEVGIKINCPVTHSVDGKITLSAKNFLDIVKELPHQDIQITKKDNNWIEVICGKSKFNIVSLSAEEFPTLPNFEEKLYQKANTKILKEMIDSTSFAVSTDATRYNLNGVYLEPLENKIIRMTGTDGHRLSYLDQPLFENNTDIKRGLIIPKKGLSEIRKLLDEAKETIEFYHERGYVFVHIENTYLFTRLIDGEYPDYRQVIPKTAEKTLRIKKEDFTSALKRVSLLSHEKSRGIKLNISSGLLKITSSNPDMGEAQEEVDIQYTGDSQHIGFNAKYLLECLQVMNDSEIELKFKDHLSPGILRSVAKPEHTYVIMPMRI
jgi:DNA polymerase-3 subunit beta